jgi:exodeoxyribonuclease VIII
VSTETQFTPHWDDGKIIGESNAFYHACDAVGSSKLKVFKKSPQLYFRKFVAKTIPRDEPTDAMAIGTAAHALILEGRAAYLQTVAIRPDGIDRRTTAGKAAWAAFVAQAAGKAIIDAEGAALVERMAASVAAHPTASALLAGCVPEISWRASVGGLRVQCRTDAFGTNTVEVPGRAEPVGLRVVDLKTCESVNEGDYGSFQKQFWDMGYYRQAGFYLALLTSLLPKDEIPESGIPFFFVAVEKNEPFQTLVVEPDQEALRIGFEEAMEDLKALRACMASGIWPGSPETLQSIALPEWMVRKIEKRLAEKGGAK